MINANRLKTYYPPDHRPDLNAPNPDVPRPELPRPVQPNLQAQHDAHQDTVENNTDKQNEPEVHYDDKEYPIEKDS